jgi:predicted ArsR family transcriptional regulator
MTQHHISDNDREMIGLLRSTPDMTIGQLVEDMGVTATAVRQRLNRLMALGMVDRSQTSEGRGRPSHHYELTEKGRKSLANNLGDLAVVLWQEVQRIADEETRQRVISGAVQRLAEKYEADVHGETTEERMKSISQLFARQQIPISYEISDGLPIIKVSGCPYPTLAADNRQICEMEKQLLAKIIGGPIDRCQCQQDGDACCSYQETRSEVGGRNLEAQAN